MAEGEETFGEERFMNFCEFWFEKDSIAETVWIESVDSRHNVWQFVDSR